MSSPPPEPMSEPKRRRVPHAGWFVLLAVVLACIAIWLGVVRPWQQQMAFIERHGFTVTVEQVPVGPEWLREMLGKEAIKGLDEIRKVEFWLHAPDTEDLEFLARNSRLEELWIGEYVLTHGAPSSVIPLTGGQLDIVGRMTQLKSLVLKNCTIEKFELNSISCLHNLSTLGLAGIPLAGQDLRQLTRLSKLEHLNLSATGISDQELIHFVTLPKLKHLWLRNTSVTDVGLKTIKQNKHLVTLSLDNTGVTDVGVTQLAELTSLESLWLQGTKITDASVPVLERFSNLEFLAIFGSNISVEGYKRLRSALPSCRISSQHSYLP